MPDPPHIIWIGISKSNAPLHEVTHQTVQIERCLTSDRPPTFSMARNNIHYIPYNNASILFARTHQTPKKYVETAQPNFPSYLDFSKANRLCVQVLCSRVTQL